MSRTKQPLGVYIHIPFCARKCAYCDFLSAPASAETMERYVECLKEEIRAAAEGLRENYQAATVFFGGGTPSILPGRLLCSVLEELYRQLPVEAGAEITVECNPGTLTEEKLSAYRAAGVNRLSIGLQSADNRELKTLGRIHTYEEFLESFELARRKGFRNLNVDLMSALPGQTREGWLSTLSRVAELGPEHISAYMDACDVIFTKPGGLTSTEAAVKGIPIVHTRPIPGCETRNLQFFTERGMSVTASKIGGQINAGQELLRDESRREKMCEAQKQVIPRDAAERIYGLLRQLSE